MGKRGPAPKGEYSGKSVVFSTRLRPDTREALVDAAKESGRSLSQEVEFRLRRSFTEDEKIADVFGSRKNFAIMRLIAALANGMEGFGHRLDPSRKKVDDWTADPYAFDQVARATAAIFEILRPGPAPEPKDDDLDVGAGLAWSFIHFARSADPSLPLSKGSSVDHAWSVIRNDLGDDLLKRTSLIADALNLWVRSENVGETTVARDPPPVKQRRGSTRKGGKK